MGLLNQSDWAAKWIEDPGYTYATNGVPNPLPIFGKAFDAAGPIAKARLYMTGLGQYAARLNGQPVSDAAAAAGKQCARHRDRQRRLPAGRQHAHGPLHVPAGTMTLNATTRA
jgi:Alpha-L-rhamnosidase N-terminal domain